ncbi:MAG: hypothetical protein J6P16_00095 [Eubacterium sp.]|nr:hypothetical protein [Eubacterium sp.]
MSKGIDVSTLNTYNPYAALFGNTSDSSSSSMGWMSGISDLKMIQSGAYKKALKSVYEKEGKDAFSEAVQNTISGSGTTDSEKSLSSLKSGATGLYSATKELRSLNFDTASDEKIASSVESFVKNYNTTLNATKNLNSYGILQTQVWATEKLQGSETMLNKAGITINADNTLSLDKDALKSADKSTLKTLFSGSGSLADSINQKSSALINQATNQLATNTGKAIYSSSGTLF